MKRILLIILALVLFLGGALLIYRLIAGRRSPPVALPSDTIEQSSLPETDLAASPLPPVSDATQGLGGGLGAPPVSAQVRSLACPEQWGGLPDTDRDGLPDQVEEFYQTNVQRADTDSDGFTDGEEVRMGYDPRRSAGNPRLDTDGDGLLEHDECRWRTDPQNPDTDGDGFQDGQEVRNKFDPTIRGDGQGSDALPERRALDAQIGLEGFRPNRTSDNLTERVAADLFGNRPPSELNTFSPPPEDVQRALDRLPRNTALPDIPLSELSVSPSNTPADIQRYLTAVAAAEPLPADATAISTAISTAFQGDPTSLRTLRNGLEAYENTLRSIPVPPTAMTYHRQLIGFVRFTTTRFYAVETSGATDPARAYLALRELQDGTPTHSKRLLELRAELERIAAGTAVTTP